MGAASGGGSGAAGRQPQPSHAALSIAVAASPALRAAHRCRAQHVASASTGASSTAQSRAVFRCFSCTFLNLSAAARVPHAKSLVYVEFW